MSQLLFLALTCILAPLIAVSSEAPQIIVYYTQWAIYQRRFCPTELFKQDQFRGMTHIQYSFFAPDEDCVVKSADPAADVGDPTYWQGCEKECGLGDAWPVSAPSKNRGNIGCIRKLMKETNRDVKLGVSLGGWTMSTHFSKCVSTPQYRNTMIDSLIGEVESSGWDFIDFDWEYPHGGNDEDDVDGVFHGTPEDWANFQLLVPELRAKLDQKRYTDVKLSGAFGMNPNLLQGTGKYENATPMKWLCDNLDFVSTMSYDLFGGWDTMTGWPAPLGQDKDTPYAMADQLNIDWHLKLWAKECGSNVNKLILGLPAYAKSWRDVEAGPNNNGMYQQCTYKGPGAEPWPELPCLGDGSFRETTGTLELWDIELVYKLDTQCSVYWNVPAKQEFIYCPGGNMYHLSGKSVSNLWFSYDAPETYYHKVKLARELGLGGWMIWDSGYVGLGEEGPLPGTGDGGVVNGKYDKSAKIKEGVGIKGTRYLFTPFEDAAFLAWENKSLREDLKSTGIRVGEEDQDPEVNPKPEQSFACSDVTTATIEGVESPCKEAFCTDACLYFEANQCSAATPETKRSCINAEFTAIPGGGISCVFA